MEDVPYTESTLLRSYDMSWETFERIVKMAGIIGGLAAAVGIYVQLSDINRKEKEKKIEDWQTGVVYEIIGNSKTPISLTDISIQYTSAAQKFPQNIPREKLDDAHLHLALIRLIQSQSIIAVRNGVYTTRNYLDSKESSAAAFKMVDDLNRQTATHIQLAFEQLSQENKPLTHDQLKRKIISVGGSASFLQDNYPTMLQQMNTQGYLKFTGDGRVVAGGIQGHREEIWTVINPPPEVSRILPTIDIDTMQFIMTTRPDSGFRQCFLVKEPDELRDSSLLGKLSKLDLIRIVEISDMKDEDGRHCALAVQVDYNALFADVQSYYFTYLKTLMDSKSTQKHYE
jgi:hypothetical protein